MLQDLCDFVQESGRARRDREASESIVMLPVEVPKDEQPRKRGGINSRIAGKRRQASEVVILRHKNEKVASREDEEIALEVNDFINAKCRRIVLDRVMDGRFDRTECEAGEEICDACEESRRIRRISN